MAQWPIVRTQRTMPGTATGGFRGSLNYPDDAIREWEKFAANMKDLSKDFADEFKRRRLQRIADQTDEFKLRYAEEQEKFSVALSNEQDPEKYPAMYEKFNNHVSSSFMPKDPLAAQAARFYVRAKDIPNRKFIRGLQTAKYKDRWFGRYGALKVDVEQGTRTLNELTFMQMEGKNLGYIGEEQAGDDFRETKKIADYKRWSNIAKVEPEKVINSIEIKDGKKVIGYIPDLKDTGDIEAIESIAEGRYFDIIARRKRISLDTRTKINEKADDPNFSSIEFEEEVTKAVDMHEITPEQGDTMRGVWKEARKTVSEGNPNPYHTTTKPEVFGRIRDNVIAGKSSLEEIQSYVGQHGYSTGDEAYLIRLFNGDESKSEAATVSLSEKTINDVRSFELEAIKESGDVRKVAKANSVYDQMIIDLRKWVREGPRTETEINEKTLSMLAPIKEDIAKDIVKGKWYDKLYPKWTTLGLLRSVAGKVSDLRDKIDPELPRITTDDEYDALPSGAEFIDTENGKKYRKP